MREDEDDRNPLDLLSYKGIGEHFLSRTNMVAAQQKKKLTCGIEQSKGVRFITNHDGDSIVIEYLGKKHFDVNNFIPMLSFPDTSIYSRYIYLSFLLSTYSWDVFGRKFVGCIRNK